MGVGADTQHPWLRTLTCELGMHDCIVESLEVCHLEVLLSLDTGLHQSLHGRSVIQRRLDAVIPS